MAVQKDNETRQREAIETLDRMRHEAGGALTGAEARERWGLDPKAANPDPPLDYRLTPRNLLIQLGAVLIALVVLWFVVDTFIGGAGAILAHLKPQ